MATQRDASSGSAVLGTGWSETFMGGSAEAERGLFRTLIDKVKAIQDAAASAGSAAQRAFHHKGDLLDLRFTVRRDLAEQWCVGFLQPGATYAGVGRFSRSSSRSGADADFDERGFAFRLQIGPGANDVQDVLLSNSPRSFARDPLTFMDAGLAFASSSNEASALLRLATAVGPIDAGRIALQLKLETTDVRTTFTTQRYWSRTPFRLGAAAVKLALVPASEAALAESSGRDFLRDRLRRDLAAAPQSFSVCVQPFVDAARTPIEDAAVTWLESDSPLIPIADLTLPQQDLANEDALRTAATREVETAFNPWNTRDLLPLGAMNRARKIAYDASAANRGAHPLPSVQR